MILSFMVLVLSNLAFANSLVLFNVFALNRCFSYRMCYSS